MSSLVETPADTDVNSLNWLDGYEVMILNGSDSLDKTEVEQRIAKVGGRIVQSPPENFDEKFLAIAGKDCGIRVKNFKALNSFDLIDFSWFLECEKQSKLLDLKSKNYIFITERTKEKLKNQIVTIESNEELREIINNIVEYDRDPEAINLVCKEFLKHQIELPKWQKGFNQFIPLNKPTAKSELNAMKDKFEKLKLEMIGARFI